MRALDPMDLSAMMEMFFIHAVRYGSHWLRVAMKTGTNEPEEMYF